MDQNQTLNMLKQKAQSLGDKVFKINDAEFHIAKLPPLAGMDLLEFIRASLAKTSNGIDAGDSNAENIALFFKTILALPPADVKYIRDELFKNIEFKSPGVDRGLLRLSGSEDMAFQGFEIINIYEVLVRALYVNFSGSFSGIGSLFPGVEAILSQSAPET